MSLEIMGSVMTARRTPVSDATVTADIEGNVYEARTTERGTFSFFIGGDGDFNGKHVIGRVPSHPQARPQPQDRVIADGRVELNFVVADAAPSWPLRFARRLGGALSLQRATYHHIAAGSGTPSPGEITAEAAVIALLGCLLLGAMAPGKWIENKQLVAPPLATALSVGVTVLIAWIVGAVAVFVIGTRLVRGESPAVHFPAHLRTLGYALVPLIFSAVTPAIISAAGISGAYWWFIPALWAMAATVVATRETLGYVELRHAILVALIGSLLTVALVAIVWRIATGGAPPSAGAGG